MASAAELSILINERRGQTGGLAGVHGDLDKIEKKGGGVMGVMGGVGKAIALAGVAGAVGIGFLAKSVLGAASDMNENMSKVGVVFGQSADQVKRFAESAAQNLGLSESAALAAVGTFGNLFVAMGIGVKPAADMSQGILTLAADLASFNNIPVDMALEKIRAGLVGETEPLRTLGVNLSAAAIQTKALALGFAATAEELTPAMKAQAAYALILEQTTTAQGDFARTRTGMANSLRIIQASFADARAEIGNRLLPIIAPLIAAFAAKLPAGIDTAGRAMDWLVGRLRGPLNYAFVLIRDSILTFKQALSGDWENASSIRPLHRIVGQFGSILHDRVIPAVKQFAGFIRDDVVPAVQGFIDRIQRIVAAFQEGGLSGALLQYAEELFGFWSGVVAFLKDTVLPLIVEALVGLGEAFVNWITPYIPKAIEALQGFANQARDWILGTGLETLTEAISGWITAATEWIEKTAPIAIAKFEELVGQIGDWLTGTGLPMFAEKLGEWTAAAVAWVGPVYLKLEIELLKLLAQIGEWIVTTALPAIVVKLATWYVAFYAWVLTEAAPRLVSALGTLLTDYLAPWITDTALPAIKTALIAWGSAFIDWVAKDAIPFIRARLGDLYLVIAGWITTAAAALVTKLGEWATSFLGWVADVITGIPGKLADILTTLGQWVIDNAEAVATKMVGIGTSILSGIASGIRDNASAIVGAAIDWALSFVPGWAKSVLGISSPSKVMIPIGVSISEGIATGIVDGVEKYVKPALAYLTQAILDGTPPGWSAVTSPGISPGVTIPPPPGYNTAPTWQNTQPPSGTQPGISPGILPEPTKPGIPVHGPTWVDPATGVTMTTDPTTGLPTALANITANPLSNTGNLSGGTSIGNGGGGGGRTMGTVVAIISPDDIARQAAAIEAAVERAMRRALTGAI